MQNTISEEECFGPIFELIKEIEEENLSQFQLKSTFFTTIYQLKN